MDGSDHQMTLEGTKLSRREQGSAVDVAVDSPTTHTFSTPISVNTAATTPESCKTAQGEWSFPTYPPSSTITPAQLKSGQTEFYFSTEPTWSMRGLRRSLPRSPPVQTRQGKEEERLLLEAIKLAEARNELAEAAIEARRLLEDSSEGSNKEEGGKKVQGHKRGISFLDWEPVLR